MNVLLISSKVISYYYIFFPFSSVELEAKTLTTFIIIYEKICIKNGTHDSNITDLRRLMIASVNEGLSI